jgi:hypothetical protein
MRMIVRPSLGPSVGKVASVGCGCASIPMGRRCKTTCTVTPGQTPLVTRMNGGGTIISIGSTPRCVMARKNGHATTMTMASVKSTPTLSKACGPRHAISCAPFVASTRSICTTTWQCANIRSISDVSVPSSSLGLSLGTGQLHEPIGYATYH